MKLSEQSAKLSEEQVRYNVQKAYYSLVIAQKQYRVLKNTLAYTRSMASEQAALYKEGFSEKIDVDRLSVTVNNLATDSLRTGSLLEISEQMLKFSMGMDIDKEIVLADTGIEQGISDAKSMLLTDLNYNERTEYNLLQSQLTLNKYDLKRHKLSGLPSLSAFCYGSI